VLLEPVCVNQPRPIVVGIGEDGRQERLVLDHGRFLCGIIMTKHPILRPNEEWSIRRADKPDADTSRGRHGG
jgi:hypothetical protein